MSSSPDIPAAGSGPIDLRRLAWNLKRFLVFVKPYRKYGLGAVLLLFLSTLAQLPTPLVTKYVIDEVLIGTGRLSIDGVGGFLMLLLAATLVVGYFSSLLAGVLRERVVADIEAALFAHICRLPLRFFHEKQSGYLLSRIGGDAGSLQGLLAETAVNALRSVFVFIVGVVALLVLNTTLALGCLALIPLYVVAIRFFTRRIRRASGRMQEASARVWGRMDEYIQNVFTIKCFRAENACDAKTRSALDNQVAANLDFLRENVTYGGSTGLVAGLASTYVLVLGGRQVIDGDITLGSLMAFLAFVGYVFGPVRSLATLSADLQTSIVCLERIFELFDEPAEQERDGGRRATDIPQPVAPVPPAGGQPGRVTMTDVEFSYEPGRPAIRGLSLDIPEGATVALVGRSGSGKTTTAMLLLKLYRRYRGHISLGGVPLRDLDTRLVRRGIAIVPQDIHLFSGSILENVRCGDTTITRRQVVDACRLANINEFVDELSAGLDTELGSAGVKLSGGQKQRLAIARALARRPQLLILDEATSDLDSESEEMIATALGNVADRCSLLIIAHRLATVVGADRIYVLDRGEVVGSGVHEELLDRCALYRELCGKQLALVQK